MSEENKRELGISVAHVRRLLTRRNLLIGGGSAALAGLVASNGDRLSSASGYQPLLDLGDRGGMLIQRMAMKKRGLAPEYRLDQLSARHPRTGGFGALYIDPDPAYDRLVAERFRSWRLRVDGLVNRPLRASLDDLHQMPARTQITMHSCDQGWSAIGQWTGVPLGWLLSDVGVLPTARYVMFHAMDKMAGRAIFDSIDLFDAFHPQTILAYRFNGEDLPVGHGAPLRLRVELQIGYKNIKHIERISVIDSLAHEGAGRGGLFQEYGFQWYAGQ
jgi:DMSO/TMAO reductase YedYZ molybdopterin-dependent catalytic subunit